MSKKTGFVGGSVVLLLVLAATGYWMLFSSFAVYDDEGYILLSAREYFARGHLYETVYSQYGPAFYVLWDVLQRIIGQPVDHAWARLVTLTFWVGTAVCCALLVGRQTKSGSLSLFTLTATFLFLYFITDEPFHPGSLICFVLAASLAVAAKLIDLKRFSPAAVVVGGTGAFLLLTKINVGIFYLLSVAGWIATNVSSERVRRMAAPVVPVAFVLMAVALMHLLIQAAWVKIFIILFACGTVSVAVTAKGEPFFTRKHAASFSMAALLVGFAILFSIWVRGTSPEGLVEGVILGPLRHPGAYSYPVDWRPGTVFVAALSLILAIGHRWLSARFATQAADRLIIALRMITASALLVGIALLINFRAVGAIFSYVAPLIWIWAVPLQCIETTAENRVARNLLATVLLLQFLHAYPVGGSQESWGVFLFIPLVALGLGDVRIWLLSRASSGTTLLLRWSSVSFVIVGVVLAKVSWTAFHARRHYDSGAPLGLPGATRLRLPGFQAASYRILSINAAVHGDMLFSLPGMFSFNVWTGLPTPTAKNTTLWFTLLNEQEQRAIIDALDRSPRAVLIVQESLVEMMRANHLPMQGVLWDYVHRHFSPVFEIDGFAFWVHSGRVAIPLNVAMVGFGQEDGPTGQKRTAGVQFNLACDGIPIADIEIQKELSGIQDARTINPKQTLVTLTPIDSAGHALGNPVHASWPLTYKGLVHFEIRFEQSIADAGGSNTLLRLRGLHAENLGEVFIGH